MYDVIKDAFGKNKFLAIYYIVLSIITFFLIYYSAGLDLFSLADVAKRKEFLDNLPGYLTTAARNPCAYAFAGLFILPILFVFSRNRPAPIPAMPTGTSSSENEEPNLVRITEELIKRDATYNFLFWFPINGTHVSETLHNPKKDGPAAKDDRKVFNNPRIAHCIKLRILKYDSPGSIFQPGTCLKLDTETYFYLEGHSRLRSITGMKGVQFRSLFA